MNAIDSDLTDETFADTDVPLSGEGYFYLLNYVDDYRHLEGGIGKTYEPMRSLQRPIDLPCP